MLAKAFSQAVYGIDAFLVEVEVDVTPGEYAFNIVGLPDAAVKESKDRVRAALQNSNFYCPVRRITVNLAPADMRKEGPSLDLPIALALLGALERVKAERLREFCVVGELSLDGAVKGVAGILPITLGARASGYRGILVPEDNAAEAAVVEGIDVFPVTSLATAVDFLNGQRDVSPFRVDLNEAFRRNRYYHADFADVKGQESAKRALEIAAAGGHNVLMIGPPGSGKTMLAKRLPSILPDMTLEESIETTKIHSIAGLVNVRESLVATRPFRSPHHTISNIAMIGGGALPRPGEVSLAHNGVLFLDEMPEFQRTVLEVLRQPLEDGVVNISRASMSLSFPARFILCGSMNPCPCGYSTDPVRVCKCSPQQIHKYRTRLSGPLLDRIDLHIEVPAVSVAELAQRGRSGESSEAIRARVNEARLRQYERYRDLPHIHCNAHLGTRELKKFCVLTDSAQEMLVTALRTLGLSARAYDRIIKVARTIADIAGEATIDVIHIAEAIGYRSLDRSVT
ncbi:MAG: YifB family Mg chelatase-like AAA ATPase [Candidatus Sumerlaeaceae bacterium]|nr:YifB family Mg chelatase-like AAA ATPase [Candidatus Sumerlaeaceae bacterium]